MPIPAEEVAKHNSKESCWVAIRGKVYDLTSFLNSHPGGVKAILSRAGTDVTEDFELLHAEGTLTTLDPSCYKGEITGQFPTSQKADDLNEKSATALPALDAQLNLDDFQKTAQKVISPKGWAYYYSGSDDLVTKNLNSTIYSKVLLRPRIFVDVVKVDTSSSIQGLKTTLPLFVSPAAMARLAHPTGERGIAQACGAEGIVQMISNNASMRFIDIVKDPIDPDQKFFFQLYVQDDRAKSEKLLKEVVDTGRCHGIVLTLDAPTPGKRELDERSKNDGSNFSENSSTGVTKLEKSEGLGRALFAGTAADLTWNDLEWLAAQLPAGMPVILKGVQTYEDAVLAARHSRVKGILVSNHGGRALDQSQPALLILYEIRKYAPEVFDSVEVYVDGGIRRGTDVVKALCLGAKQVGVGRAALYGLAGYGPLGVQRTIEILRQEIETAMRLLGANSLSDLGPHCVNVRQLERLIYEVPRL
jgi:isopentenyl diphosphate isomerase/L-lactate dehydrogenase-like FMN-dependent dehydrogenase/predicted heme/steroid binding protein